jgi:hypothetical protein
MKETALIIASELERNRTEATDTWNIQETRKLETHEQSRWVHATHLILHLSCCSVIA